MTKPSFFKKQRIRVITLGLICQGDRTFVAEGYDSVQQSHFYRPLGGGVDFGETSTAALQREFLEELHTEICNLSYLGCIENIFTYEGILGHELIQLYACDFVEQRFYESEQMPFQEGQQQGTARWIDLEKCHSGELRLVPTECLQYLPKE
jgi:hypothetical protein